PEAPDNSDLVYEAYNYGKMPIAFASLNNSDTYGEDCLYLNIFKGKDDIKNKPVMVYIHGGGFVTESASGGCIGELFAMVHPEVIFVTIEYRLNFFGFTNFDDVPGGEDFDGAQNNGIKDQMMALKWVKRNIAGFGGDPDNITLFGESAGSISSSILALLDDVNHIFNKVLLQSGNHSFSFPDGHSKPAAAAMLKALGAKNMKDLQQASTQDFLDHLMDISEACHVYGPAADGKLIPKNMAQLYKEGKAKHLKFFMGFSEEECRYYTQFCKVDDEVGTERAFSRWMQSRYAKFEKELENDKECKAIADEYIALCKSKGKNETYAMESLMSTISFGIGALNLAYVCSQYNDAYLYYFVYPTYGPLKGSAHGAELFPVFNIDIEKEFQVGDYEGMKKHVGEAWVSFAKTGVPTIDGVPVAKYDTEKQNVIVFDKDGKTFARENFLTERHNMLLPMLKYECFSLVDCFFPSNEEVITYFAM
ncbi:MAG: carboxylesterase family protein, partial [Bacteroidales bacterium]|nr:carboxylesterase family protein [Bacteroidales bacterium]